MGYGKVFNEMIEEKLLHVNTAFIGKITAVDGDKCSVLPLDKIKAYGQPATAQSLLTDVPILNHVRRYTLVKQALSVSEGTITPANHPEDENVGHLKVEPLKSGDLVLCVCCQRDISSSSSGQSTTPPAGHHQIKDAVVVGMLGRWPHE